MDIPDSEGAARTWARAAVPAVAGRVFFGVPAGEPQLPLITVSRVTGVSDSDAAIDYPRLSWDVWGATKSQAADTMRALTTALRGARGTMLDVTTRCLDVDDILVAWAPDSEARLARYVVDCTMVLETYSVV